MKTVSIIGIGSRGSLYGDLIQENKENMKLVAICDTNIKKIEMFKDKYNLENDQVFNNVEEFFSKGKLSDILIIATQDKDHYYHLMKAMDYDYKILLEKPISPSEGECDLMLEKATTLNRKVGVCHVLRFTPFYSKLKEIIDSGIIGKVVTLSQTENVGYWHQAHSFVRGQWNNSNTSAPMILAKSCHDLDIIHWLMGSKCTKVSSFGSLFYFNKDNQPEGASDYCYNCPIKECPYNAIEFYKNNLGWAFKTNHYTSESDSGIEAAFSDEKNPFSRCVFSSDNNVVDHQVVNMLFEQNQTAQLTMTAFSKDIHRNIKIHGTKGEIEGDMEKNEILINVFGGQSEFIDVKKLADDFSHHGGGDIKMLKDFILEGSETLTSLNNSIHSHKIAFSSEKSRIQDGKVVDING